jgi:hypothetical protein
MTIWQTQKVLSRRVMALNAVNIAVGAALQRRKERWLRGIGVQALGWGAVNIGIAVGGMILTRRREAEADAYQPYMLAKETRNLRRLLWINTGLDVLYMLGGALFARRGAQKNRDFERGNGIGVIIQGALLFAFDVIHALKVR